MILSHCICPSFLAKNIGDDSIFYSIFVQRFIFSGDQLVFDREENLATKYIDLIEEDSKALQNYYIWQKMLDTQLPGKILRSTSDGATSVKQVVYRTISKVVTTACKSIVTDNNDNYAEFIGDINRQRIQLMNVHTLAKSNFNEKLRRPTYQEFEADLEWVLQRLGRRAEKSDSEDKNNDYLRDMLLSKNYEVKDQSREGTSASGSSAGELDLIIEDQGDLFTIIEALKLSSVDTSYINAHYLKLLLNYNPLQARRTFLVTYYYGSAFDGWWAKYVAHIASLDMRCFIGDDYDSSSTLSECVTGFPTIKKLHH